ncbi:hypothetical protein PHMEG_00034434 [Phytophthora megakarya]|uniref:Uncharacterized protein n=1 Tax=Phytophthora megakarya TaxID=4795 RepID=A0A225URH6_9STRA|nr:hypothetical protein PHMEG_00034434 [Phytophthora megakarya]
MRGLSASAKTTVSNMVKTHAKDVYNMTTIICLADIFSVELMASTDLMSTDLMKLTASATIYGSPLCTANQGKGLILLSLVTLTFRRRARIDTTGCTDTRPVGYCGV